MPQPKIGSQQVNAAEIVSAAFGATLDLSNPISGQSIVYFGSPLTLRNQTVSGGGGSVTLAAGGGLEYVGSPIELQVDSTVARTDITTETFSFAGDVSLNLNDTSQAADEDIWRVSATGSNFVISTRTDADAAGNSAITFARTGTTVDTATVPAPTHLTASGTGTSSALHLSSNVPTLVFNDNDAAANAGIWDVTSGTNQLLFRTRTDAHGTGATWLTVNRSGTTVGEVAFTGTSLTFNGIPVIVGGSPYTGGGGGVTSSVGSPANTRVAYFTTDGNITGAANLTNDGSDVTVSDDLWISGANPRIYVQEIGAPANEQNWFFGTTNGSFHLALSSDASPTIGATIFQINRTGSNADDMYINTANFEVSNGNEFRIADDDLTDWVRMRHDGSDFLTDFTNTNDWKIKSNPGAGSPNVYGTVWFTRSFGSPQFGDLSTSTTKPTVRIGFGSPVTTRREGTLTLIDNWGPGLVLRDPNTSGEVSFNVQTNNEFVTSGVNFTTFSIHDVTSDNSYTFMSMQHEVDPVLQLQELPISDLKRATQTNATQSSTDAFTTNTSADVYFVACGSPSGGFITIGGITGGVDGRTITIFNTTAGGPGSPSDLSNLESVVLEHEEATASANNRILCPNRFDVTIGEYEAAVLVYDGNVSRWRIQSTTASESGA